MYVTSVARFPTRCFIDFMYVTSVAEASEGEVIGGDHMAIFAWISVDANPITRGVQVRDAEILQRIGIRSVSSERNPIKHTRNAQHKDDASHHTTDIAFSNRHPWKTPLPDQSMKAVCSARNLEQLTYMQHDIES